MDTECQEAPETRVGINTDAGNHWHRKLTATERVSLAKDSTPTIPTAADIPRGMWEGIQRVVARAYREMWRGCLEKHGEDIQKYMASAYREM